jgi:hypothetical protein
MITVPTLPVAFNWQAKSNRYQRVARFVDYLFSRIDRQQAPGGNNWVVSDTTSPVDYTPIVSANTASRGGSDGSLMQLSIHCRSSPRNTPVLARRLLRDVPASIFR